ncbi:uracil-DNA glycosylase [Gephyromycinifex aptenodytis]|uniref:uracil-DNA glycosylase n=1 Tax=Gephyromycinifex aptenodytis TaxID=2716227 RepID=UPI00144830DD|nr:uracil-DNA glycosylase [Gephyromycinifex aptenodytis]
MTESRPDPAPHPITGQLFRSPVPPGSGWPQDPATPATAVAKDGRDVQRIAVACTEVAEVDAAVSVCRACPRLVQWREDVARTRRAAFADQPYWGRPVPGFGAQQPRVLVVGLAPAAHGANRTGRMFTGDRSGEWLYAALYRAGFADRERTEHAGDGLTLHQMRIVAPVRCAPPQNAPTAQEKATCAPWLDRELAFAAPGLRSILALGQIGWTTTLAAARRGGWSVPRPRPAFGHAAQALLATPDGSPVRLVGSYHVSQQNTFTGRLTERMLDAAIALL